MTFLTNSVFTGDQNYKTRVINVWFYSNFGVSDQLQVGTHGVKVSPLELQKRTVFLNRVFFGKKKIKIIFLLLLLFLNNAIQFFFIYWKQF